MWLRWPIAQEEGKPRGRKFTRSQWPGMFFAWIICWPVNIQVKWWLRDREKRVVSKNCHIFLTELPMFSSRKERGVVPNALEVKTNAEFPFQNGFLSNLAVYLLSLKLSFCNEILCYPPVTFSCMHSTEVWVYCFPTRELILQQLLIYWGHLRSVMWLLWGTFFQNLVNAVCWNLFNFAEEEADDGGVSF